MVPARTLTMVATLLEKPYVHRRKRLQRIGGKKRGDQGGKHSQEKDRQQEGGVGKRSKEFCQRTCRRMSPCCHRIEKRNPIMLMAQAMVNGV